MSVSAAAAEAMAKAGLDDASIAAEASRRAAAELAAAAPKRRALLVVPDAASRTPALAFVVRTLRLSCGFALAAPPGTARWLRSCVPALADAGPDVLKVLGAAAEDGAKDEEAEAEDDLAASLAVVAALGRERLGVAAVERTEAEQEEAAAAAAASASSAAAAAAAAAGGDDGGVGAAAATPPSRSSPAVEAALAAAGASHVDVVVCLLPTLPPREAGGALGAESAVAAAGQGVLGEAAALVRAGALNFAKVAVVTDAAQFDDFCRTLERCLAAEFPTDGSTPVKQHPSLTTLDERRDLARQALVALSARDAALAQRLADAAELEQQRQKEQQPANQAAIAAAFADAPPPAEGESRLDALRARVARARAMAAAAGGKTEE